jgi:hypothetical protein
LVDESKFSIVACMWTDKMTDLVSEIKTGDVIVIVSARSSDFSGKSLNLSEDSKVFINP